MINRPLKSYRSKIYVIKRQTMCPVPSQSLPIRPGPHRNSSTWEYNLHNVPKFMSYHELPLSHWWIGNNHEGTVCVFLTLFFIYVHLYHLYVFIHFHICIFVLIYIHAYIYLSIYIYIYKVGSECELSSWPDSSVG